MQENEILAQLDLQALAQDKTQLSGQLPLRYFQRLSQELRPLPDDARVQWQLQGLHHMAVDEKTYPGLHLSARAELPMTCQRCLQEAVLPVSVEQDFLFAKGEQASAELDALCEQSVLEFARPFDGVQLLEDELIMALPLVPMHEQCPDILPSSVSSPEFEEAMQARPHPFAVLKDLKKDEKDA